MTNYEQWQLEKYGDILPEPGIQPDGHTEASQQELERMAEWVNLQHANQLYEHERPFTSGY